MKEIQLEASIDSLIPLFEFVTSELSALHCSKRDIRQVKLCVEEVFVNIANYAYHPKKGDARVAIDVSDGEHNPFRVSISFTDRGRPFNPMEKEAPNLEANLEERPIGGLGIFLVRTKMDTVAYEYRDGQNILTITKNIQNAEGCGGHI